MGIKLRSFTCEENKYNIGASFLSLLLLLNLTGGDGRCRKDKG
jgi:hypothetical protein